MITFTLDPKSGVPIYRQIQDQVRYGIASGLLLPGEQLPTVRALAVELSVNPNTVIKAYTELERQWEEARPRLEGDGPPADAALVASVIADAIESTEPRLRWPVGDDSEMVVAARESMSFEDFETNMRSLLGVTW